MPEPITIFLTIFSLAGAVAIAFWDKIRQWAFDSLFPWMRDNYPNLSGTVREAFKKLDDAATAVRRNIKDAWGKLRKYLLKQSISLNKKSANTWIKKITSWVISGFENGKKKVKKYETEEEVNWDELPDDVRAAAMRSDINSREENITEVRDREMQQVY